MISIKQNDKFLAIHIQSKTLVNIFKNQYGLKCFPAMSKWNSSCRGKGSTLTIRFRAHQNDNYGLRGVEPWRRKGTWIWGGML